MINVIESVNTGRIENLPEYIRDSLSEGLSELVDKLANSQFLTKSDEDEYQNKKLKKNFILNVHKISFLISFCRKNFTINTII